MSGSWEASCGPCSEEGGVVTFQLGKATNQQMSGWFQVGRQSREANAVSRSPPTTEKSARALGPSTSGRGWGGGEASPGSLPSSFKMQ